jgi:hypothetical protein
LSAQPDALRTSSFDDRSSSYSIAHLYSLDE